MTKLPCGSLPLLALLGIAILQVSVVCSIACHSTGNNSSLLHAQPTSPTVPTQHIILALDCSSSKCW